MGSGKGKAKRVNAKSKAPDFYTEIEESIRPSIYIDDHEYEERDMKGNRIIKLTPNLKINEANQTIVIDFANVVDSRWTSYKKRDAILENKNGSPIVFLGTNSGIPLTKIIESLEESQKKEFVPEYKLEIGDLGRYYTYDHYLQDKEKYKDASSIVINTDNKDVIMTKELVAEEFAYGTQHSYFAPYPRMEEIVIKEVDGPELFRMRLNRVNEFKNLLVNARTELNQFKWKTKIDSFDKGIFKKDS